MTPKPDKTNETKPTKDGSKIQITLQSKNGIVLKGMTAECFIFNIDKRTWATHTGYDCVLWSPTVWLWGLF